MCVVINWLLSYHWLLKLLSDADVLSIASADVLCNLSFQVLMCYVIFNLAFIIHLWLQLLDLIC